MPRKPSGLFCSHACGETAEKINKLLEQFPRRLFRICNKCHAETSPGSEKPMDFSGGFRGIKPEDLLGRKQAVLDMEGIKAYVRSKTVLVTGGAGSVGSEICRQVLDYECGKLIILDINENGLFELDNELKRQYDTGRYEIVVGSVRDNGCLAHVFNQHEVHTVFHAAAHKHVPLMESNPAEAIQNNIIGTLNLASRAIDAGAEKFILISTDKAVNCTSIMGATKRAAEIMVQMQNCCSPVTRLAAVRFGNVLGSNGSVLLTFQDQIKKGGPVTVTHPEVERFFMTITEAVELVLQACFMADGGEIFVLDMGKPVKILDLAYDMIRRAGMEPGRDIRIEFTGLRPGEKMFEELTFQYETLRKTAIDKISICSLAGAAPNFLQKIQMLESTIDNQKDIDYKALLNDLIKSAGC
jgi:FlaA1/EpsC-like NDP-sugar epimerase